MIRILVVAIAICFSGGAFAQAKKSAEEVWNDLYSKREGQEHRFNKFLAEAVKGIKPGKALDIGMGQGRNSLFLAALGWDVTGFDISEVAVRQAQEAAKKRGLKIDAQVGDVDKFDYGKAKWDLVVGMYMHEYLTRNAAKVADSLKPGGLLVVEGIHRDINKNNPQGEKYGHFTNELPRAFSRLRVTLYQDTVARSDWERSGGMAVPVVRLLAYREARR